MNDRLKQAVEAYGYYCTSLSEAGDIGEILAKLDIAWLLSEVDRLERCQCPTDNGKWICYRCAWLRDNKVMLPLHPK